VFFFDQILNHS